MEVTKQIIDEIRACGFILAMFIVVGILIVTVTQILDKQEILTAITAPCEQEKR